MPDASLKKDTPPGAWFVGGPPSVEQSLNWKGLKKLAPDYFNPHWIAKLVDAAKKGSLAGRAPKLPKIRTDRCYTGASAKTAMKKAEKGLPQTFVIFLKEARQVIKQQLYPNKQEEKEPQAELDEQGLAKQVFGEAGSDAVKFVQARDVREYGSTLGEGHVSIATIHTFARVDLSSSTTINELGPNIAKVYGRHITAVYVTLPEEKPLDNLSLVLELVESITSDENNRELTIMVRYRIFLASVVHQHVCYFLLTALLALLFSHLILLLSITYLLSLEF